MDKFYKTYKGPYEKLPKWKLLQICKLRGYTRYHACTKQELCHLLRNGCYPIPKPVINTIIDYGPNGRGIHPNQLFTANTDNKYYSAQIRQVVGGYIIRGVNLEGLFNAELVTESIRVAWFISDEDYVNFVKFCNSRKPKQNPSSLQHLAGRVINSRSVKFWKDWAVSLGYTIPKPILTYVKTCK